MKGAGDFVARNARCPCGSGRRSKRCCSRDPALVALMGAAFMAELAGRPEFARRGYETVLAAQPDLPDALHRLGALDLDEGDVRAAVPRLARAVARLGDAWPPARASLGAALASACAFDATRVTDARWRDAHRAAPRSMEGARWSVVCPSHGHAHYVGEALDSVLAQSRPADELIVIDDGSTDGSRVAIEVVVARARDRIDFVARESRGAAATLNEAIARATGDWIAIVNSDDRFPPHRLATMEAALASTGAEWAFSRVEFIDAAGAVLSPGASTMADAHRALIDAVGACDSVGFAFLGGNRAISSGALVFRRELWARLGGFADLRYNHDWEFCLRAARLAEPAFVARPSYDYRIHGANTILESPARAEAERDAMLAHWYADDDADDPGRGPLAPCTRVWGPLFALRAIEAGHVAHLAGDRLARLAASGGVEAGA